MASTCAGRVGRAALAAAGVLAAGAPARAVTADVTLRRIDDDRLRVEWVFSERIQGLELFDTIDGYRAENWTLDDGTVEPAERGERIVRGGQWFDRLAATVRMRPAYPEGHYVPFARFSDGGMAIYLGYFRGAVRVRDLPPRDARFRFRVVGREWEEVVVPPAANEDVSLFAYVGPGAPEDRGGLKVLLDPEIPGWLDGVVSETLSKVDAVYEARLGRMPRARPLVLIAAADIETIDGWSVKGGAVRGEMIMITLRGRALHDGSDEVRAMMQKLVAHETAHLWQAADPAGRFNAAQPWLHEGAADALAVAALVEAGFWTERQRKEFGERTEETCRRRVPDGGLPDAASAGDWEAVYSCGYGLFTAGGRDPFEAWKALVEAARIEGRPYDQEMLEAVLRR